VKSKGETEGRQVSSYLLVDWQTHYAFTKKLSLTVGVKNIFDREPPFTLSTTGGSPIGFDGRYTDPVGRALYMAGQYKF
jgi:iron complex outermembrane receptor protein